MTIYHVPIVGFAVGVYRIVKAQSAYFACNAKGGACWAEYEATWQPFDNCTTAYVSTIIGCVVVLAIALAIGRLARR